MSASDMRGISILLVLGVVACDSRRVEKHPEPAPTLARAARQPIPTRPRPPRLLPTPAIAWGADDTTPTAEDWDATAEIRERDLATCVDDCREAAYAVVLARSSALRAEPIEPPPGDEPTPLPTRVAAVVDALDAYVAMADPLDPELGGMKFLAANSLRRWHQPDALARLEAVLSDHRDHPTAEYAANILIDTLLRTGRMAELRALVNALWADSAFLAGKDELRQTLEQLRAAFAAEGPL